MTQLERARAGEITEEMRAVAEAEGLEPEFVRRQVASGRVVIPANAGRGLPSPRGIGEGLRTKVNANIGTSGGLADEELELTKLQAALSAGADTVMDLSTGGDVGAVRRRLRQACPVPLGTVPVYEAFAEAVAAHDMAAVEPEDILEVVERHARDGVDFVTVHVGVTREAVAELRRRPRLCGVVSRGGALLGEWMRRRGQENPLYERFDDLLDIARTHDLTLSLGDGLRPGALADAGDPAQIRELLVVSELARRARRAGVQVMVEGPGHVPLNEVQTQVRTAKTLTEGAPLYLLGPIVTDVAPGYDHITAAIGGALAAAAGADYLCYVTPSEHLGLPGPEEVRLGVVAARIAAHAADVAKGLAGARAWDDRMSECRRRLDWEGMSRLALDPELVRQYLDAHGPPKGEPCTMCGEFCVYRVAAGGTPAVSGESEAGGPGAGGG